MLMTAKRIAWMMKKMTSRVGNDDLREMLETSL
jgi:hypothetical protein